MMTMDDIVARCSKFSGFSLEWRVEDRPSGKVLIIEEPGKPRSTLAVSLFNPHYLREVYGRLSHWAITLEEQEVMAQALR